MKALVLSGASNEISPATPGVVRLNAFHRSASARVNEPPKNVAILPLLDSSFLSRMLAMKLGSFHDFRLRLSLLLSLNQNAQF